MSLFILFAVVVVGFIVYSIWAQAERRKELAVVAGQLGLQFRPDKDRELAASYNYLNKFNEGANRYAFNILEGERQGQRVRIFDYHFETYTTDEKGNPQTQNHYFTVFMLVLPKTCPKLTMVKEGWLSKVAQFLGYDDIDFESAEFSKAFCVRSTDKKFAYDACNPQMIEYLLGNRDLNVEIMEDTLALTFAGQVKPELIVPNLERLLAIRRLLPEYLWNT
jgi:hypothetical protein